MARADQKDDTLEYSGVTERNNPRTQFTSVTIRSYINGIDSNDEPKEESKVDERRADNLGGVDWGFERLWIHAETRGQDWQVAGEVLAGARRWDAACYSVAQAAPGQ